CSAKRVPSCTAGSSSITAIFQRGPCSGGSSPGPSIRWTMSSSAMSFIHDWCGPRRRFARRYARDGDTKSRAPAQPGFEGQAAAQLLGYEIEDDVKAKAGAALVSARGEERVERAALDILAHAHAIVRSEKHTSE